ncbi:MAG: hypothetical protein HZB92_02855 [Euryarchaeota archaeon]|nr:hypothetical protein [Euryarchaeota archaeon]
MTEQDAGKRDAKRARYKWRAALASVILIIILLVKIILPIMGLALDANPISGLHWSYYVLAVIGALFYAGTLLGNVRSDFDGWRAASDAVSRLAQAVIYTIIILNIYGNVIVINAQANVTVSGAIIALFVGLYVKLFENTIAGIARKINDAISPDAKERSDACSKCEKIKEELDMAYDQLIAKNSREPEKYREEIATLVRQIESNAGRLKEIIKFISDNEMERARIAMLEVEATVRATKLKFGLA